VFESELALKLKQIFAVDKVIYDSPSEAREQNCLFIQIESTRNSIKDGKALAMVTGSAFMFQKNTALKFGFFSKAIRQADTALTKDLFFYDIEVNTPNYRDLVQRGFSFIYFFNSQYDPEIGTITSVDLTLEET
jgi:hypothetical protein